MSDPTTIKKNSDMCWYRKGFSKKDLKRYEELMRVKDSQPEAKTEIEELLASCAKRGIERTARASENKATWRIVKRLNEIIGSQYLIFCYEEVFTSKAAIGNAGRLLGLIIGDELLFQVFVNFFSLDGTLVNPGPFLVRTKKADTLGIFEFYYVERVRDDDIPNLYVLYRIFAFEKQFIHEHPKTNLKKYLEKMKWASFCIFREPESSDKLITCHTMHIMYLNRKEAIEDYARSVKEEGLSGRIISCEYPAFEERRGRPRKVQL